MKVAPIYAIMAKALLTCNDTCNVSVYDSSVLPMVEVKHYMTPFSFGVTLYVKMHMM